MSTPEEQPGFSDVPILSHFSLALSVLEKANKGGNPCSRSNHDNGLEGIRRKMECVFETWEDGNLHLRVYV